MAYINSSTHDHFVELYIETLVGVTVDEIFDPATRKATIDAAIGGEGSETGLKIPGAHRSDRQRYPRSLPLEATG